MSGRFAGHSPGGGGFPGFGEGAPLDVQSSPSIQASLVARIADQSFEAFADTAAGVGYCHHPVRLVGNSTTYDTATGQAIATFSSAELPLGVLYRACGNRRSDVCPPCSRVYARDTFELIRAGLLGGKGVPETVRERPLLFATFTAPSFGPVHSAKSGKRCHPRDTTEGCPHGRATRCMAIHAEDDPMNGAPLCGDCYDWVGAMVWQCWSSCELFRRTGQNIARELARSLGLTQTVFRRLASVQYVKVAEYQHRGLIHFHAMIRLDGREGPGSAPALDVDAPRLAAAVIAAARRTTFTAPPIDAEDHERRLTWGTQIDAREVHDDRRPDELDKPLSAEQVAGYIAKYATKDVTGIRRPNGHPRQHLIRFEQLAAELSRRAGASSTPVPEYVRLAKWAHMLGFPGHFSSKSRRYSVTLGSLRRARYRFQAARAEAQRRGELLDLASLEQHLLDDSEETTLVIGTWTYQGTGWKTAGDQALAVAASVRAQEYDRWRAERRRVA